MKTPQAPRSGAWRCELKGTNDPYCSVAEAFEGATSKTAGSKSQLSNALCELVGDLERNTSLYEPDRLRERIEALDQFDVFNLEMIPAGTDSTVAAVYRRARAIQARLEAANFKVYEAIRRDLTLGRGAQSLLDWVPSSDTFERVPGLKKDEAYNYLDEFLDGVFRFEQPGRVIVQPTAEMVFYQPTPARHIFDLLDRTALTEHDLLIDLGSGLGHVPLLTCICTRARSVGVEIEPGYVDSARQCAETLNLKGVTFIQQDARAANLTEGTVFYLYTPFTGKTLRAVLDSLRCEGANRDIRVCTLGPCTMSVANEDWLEAVGSARTDRISIFRSSNGCCSKR